MTRSLHDPKLVMGNQGMGNEEGDLLSDSASSQMSVSNYHLSGGCTKDHASDTTSDTASATSGNSKVEYYLKILSIIIDDRNTFMIEYFCMLKGIEILSKRNKLTMILFVLE